MGAVAAMAVTALGATVCPARATAEKPQTHTVEIKNFKFAPRKLQVRPGDTILWINRDIVPHTATAGDQGWDTGSLKRGQSKSLEVRWEMTFAYICRFHPSMKAEITVTAKP